MISLGDSLKELGEDGPGFEIKCAICEGRAMIPGFVVSILKAWNRSHPAERPIMTGDIEIGCSPKCRSDLYRRRHAASEKEHETTRAMLGMLLAGNHNAESRAWLRRHDLGRYVDRQLAKEGNSNVPGA